VILEGFAIKLGGPTVAGILTDTAVALYVAVITVDPGATAVTTPDALTVATPLFCDVKFKLLELVKSEEVPSANVPLMRSRKVCPSEESFNCAIWEDNCDGFTEGSTSIEIGVETTVCPSASTAQAEIG
jgi:hypothetical protein